MATLGLAGIKAQSIAKDTEEKRCNNREKAMLLFAFQLLLDNGYIDTASSLAAECSLNLEQFTMCENIDLNTIFIDFEAYYNLRFQRYPQYFRKVSNNGAAVGEGLLSKLAKQKKCGSTTGGIPQRRAAMAESDPSTGPGSQELSPSSSQFNITNSDKLLKPISGLDFGSDDTRCFAEMIQREIVLRDLDTKWEDVVGLENAKMVLMESIVYRNEFSNFFGDALSPWRGLLLYGPVGTGKTLLAKAVASECGTTFFNISSSSIVSKWRGDSEKIVKVLFELARHHAPSTIFFDEFDALASNRDTSGESDASRRLKSELLQQMDGLLSSAQPQLPIFVLAATNLPWELDPAMVRRMEKRIYVPLPNACERCSILKLHFSKTAKGIGENSKGRNSLNCNFDFERVAEATEGYSGSDLQQVVKEAVVVKFRTCFQDKSKLRKMLIDPEDIAHALHDVAPTVKENVEKKFLNWERGLQI